MERDYAERRPELKQVIPYGIVTCEERVLLVRRTKGGGEARLHDKLSIGIGGHINPVDAGSGTGREAVLSDLFTSATRREIELHQCIHGGLCRVDNVEKAVVGATLELLTRLLVHVRSAQHCVAANTGGKRHGTCGLRAGARYRFDDLCGRLIEQLVIVGFEPNPNLLGHRALRVSLRVFRDGTCVLGPPAHGRMDAGLYRRACHLSTTKHVRVQTHENREREALSIQLI